MCSRKGHARVIVDYKAVDGFKLGIWVRVQRKNREKLTKEQIMKLESLEGWKWDASKLKWEQGFYYLDLYVQQEGHANVPQKYKTSDGFNLGTWVAIQRKNRAKLSEEWITRLGLLGFFGDISLKG